MANINQFLSEIKGLQRANRFHCTIDATSLIDTDKIPLSVKYPDATRLLQRGIVCPNTSLPNRRFETTPQTIYGFSVDYPIKTTYGDLECQFLIPLSLSKNYTGPTELGLGDQTNELLHFFYTWHNLIQDHRPNRELVFQFPDTYRIREGFYITTYDDSYRPTSRIQFHNVYPLVIGQATLDWAQTDFLSFPVTFSFTHWNTIDESQLGGTGNITVRGTS